MVAQNFLPEINQSSYVRKKAKWKQSHSYHGNTNQGSDKKISRIQLKKSRQRLFDDSSERNVVREQELLHPAERRMKGERSRLIPG